MVSVPSVVPSIVPQRAKHWYDWFADDDTPEERKLILKLDMLIVPYAFVVYWVKYLDQANISKCVPPWQSGSGLT